MVVVPASKTRVQWCTLQMVHVRYAECTFETENQVNLNFRSCWSIPNSHLFEIRPMFITTTNLDKSSRKTSSHLPHPSRWRNTVLKQGNVTVRRRTFGVHHSLLLCLKVEPMSEHQQKKSNTFPSQTSCRVDGQNPENQLIWYVCLNIPCIS